MGTKLLAPDCVCTACFCFCLSLSRFLFPLTLGLLVGVIPAPALALVGPAPPAPWAWKWAKLGDLLGAVPGARGTGVGVILGTAERMVVTGGPLGVVTWTGTSLEIQKKTEELIPGQNC